MSPGVAPGTGGWDHQAVRAPLLSIEVDRIDAGSARLRLAGELDFDTAPDLVEAAAGLRRDGHQELWLDFAGVTLCDSSGLSALLVVHRAGAGAVHLLGLNPRIQRLLDRTGLADVLAVAPHAAPGATHDVVTSRAAAADAREVG
ncbi:STAS domain-containing protein [Micromonospora sp. WMMD1128]|uniref:STAS domain-containing protein n=1 Tax=unclassified Micromonospora TaxID=2617518 RepID=UPI00248D3006|nr:MULTISPECIES: STAS domain-containing protein [unclassified Micromonospora]WBB76845.1 STAS domain-containing protein [Micromonospora sp. WMMD1128]WFE35370.1 STAS domain-containing protein [Micromonospora sp. WMMD975]